MQSPSIDVGTTSALDGPYGVIVLNLDITILTDPRDMRYLTSPYPRN